LSDVLKGVLFYRKYKVLLSEKPEYYNLCNMKGIVLLKFLMRSQTPRTYFVLCHVGKKLKWRRLHNEELYNLYRSPNIVRVIKSRRLRWAVKPKWKKVGVASKF
jgi:hypothetical protein